MGLGLGSGGMFPVVALTVATPSTEDGAADGEGTVALAGGILGGGGFGIFG